VSIEKLQIKNVFDGQSATDYFGTDGSFNTSIAVDPDFGVGSTVKTSGILVPTNYKKFSGANINGDEIAIITNPKDALVYVILRNGRIISYNSSLGSETLVDTVAGSNATGAEYYNNFIYIIGTGASKDDVSRYGPLNNSPVLTDNVWKGATLGSQAALTNTTYPTIRGIQLPNHPTTVHQADNVLYFGDFKDGQGLIHKIKTTKGTDEGDTDNGSGFNALDLSFSYMPTSLASIGTLNDIMISGIQTSDSTVNQGESRLFLWDSTNTTSFDLDIFIDDPLVTAMKKVGGTLYIWSGNAQNGVRLSRWLGGESVQSIEYLEEGLPPSHYAVDSLGDRIIWGGFVTTPEAAACVFSFGSKRPDLPIGINNIARATSTGANQMVYALKFVLQADNKRPQMVIAWRDDTTQGIDQLDTAATKGSAYSSFFQKKIVIGKTFEILEIRVPLTPTLATNMSLIPTIFVDDATSATVTLTTINSTNFSGFHITFKNPELNGARGENNFLFRLNWQGTVELAVPLPIDFIIDIHEDD